MGTTQEFFELVYRADTAPVKAMDAALAEQHDALNLVGQDVYELAGGTDKLTRAFAATDVQFVAAKPALTAFDRELIASTEATQRANAVQRALADSVGAVVPAAGKATGGMKDMGRGVLEVSRGLEDMQYGLAGVLNNIPQAVLAFGGPAGLAGVISLVAVGAKVLYDHWSEIETLFSHQNAIPKATDQLKGHEAALKQVNKELEAFEGRTSLSNTELLKFNTLTAKAAELEKERAALQEAEANRKAHGQFANQAARERAGAFGEAVDEFGGMPKLVEDILARSTQGATAKEVAAFKAYLDNLIGAALKGDRAAIHEVGVVGRGTGIEGMLSATDPAAKRAEEKFVEQQRKNFREKKKLDAEAIDEANRAEASSIESAGHQATEEATKKAARKKAAEAEADQTRRAVQAATNAATARQKQAIAREAKPLGAAGLSEEAGMSMASSMNMGATGGQAQALAIKQMTAFLRQQGYEQQKAAALATSITGEAAETLKAQLVSANAMGQNQAALYRKHLVLQGAFNKLATDLRQLNQRIEAGGPTALNGGAPTP